VLIAALRPTKGSAAVGNIARSQYPGEGAEQEAARSNIQAGISNQRSTSALLSVQRNTTPAGFSTTS
jgi:hypothetical protein